MYVQMYIFTYHRHHVESHIESQSHISTVKQIVTDCNTLEHDATCCNALQHTLIACLLSALQRSHTRLHTATHCNILQDTTARHLTPQHAATVSQHLSAFGALKKLQQTESSLVTSVALLRATQGPNLSPVREDLIHEP